MARRCLLPLIDCPWHEGYHNSRLAVRVCKQMLPPTGRCTACRRRKQRGTGSWPYDCVFHQKYPDLEQGDWTGAYERERAAGVMS